VPHLLNLEMACVSSIVDIACEVKPDQVTLVPERREELTTEGGLDVVAHQQVVGQTMERLKKAGIEVALFLDPDDRQLEIARRLGARAVEIQTARYSEARNPTDRERELAALTGAAEYLRSHQLHVHMGHGLNYCNVKAIACIPGVEELNIGHSIVSRAVLVGMERAVREMKDAIRIRD
jgi:pyridoxine 5-phosphate synthase